MSFDKLVMLLACSCSLLSVAVLMSLAMVGHRAVSMWAAQVVRQWFHRSSTSNMHSSAEAFGYMGMSILHSSTLCEKNWG